MSKKWRLFLLVLLSLPAASFKAHSVSGPYISGHGGFAGMTGSHKGGLGMGASFGYHTGDLFGLDFSVTYHTAGPNKLNIPLALTTTIWEFDSLHTQIQFGGGFTTLNGTNFLLDFGASGDFYVNSRIAVGLLFRYDVVISAVDEGFVLIRVKFHFPGFGGEGGDDIWD